MEVAVQFLVKECRAGRENRFRYIIYMRRIWSASTDWQEREYTGSNPHDHHAHFSFKYGSGSGTSNPENDTSSYGLKGLIDVPLDSTDKTWLKSAEFTGAVATAVTAVLTKTTALNGPDGKPDGTNSTPVGSAVMAQGIPNPFAAGKRTTAYKVIGDSAAATKAMQEAGDAAEAAALAAATKTLVQQLLELVQAGGGSVDSAAVLAKLDAVQEACVTAARQAGDAASRNVMDSMRRAAAAEVTALGDLPDALTEAVAAQPPQG
jgi:hypothetical protein